MAVTSYELVTIAGDALTLDLLIWRRYRTPYPGILEAALDANPHLAKIHKETPFLPPGTQVRIPIDTDVIKGQVRQGEVEFYKVQRATT
jgi:phage tail protein X